jgi:hypothetical protein
MRTTIDVPDPLFRKTKAAAALRGEPMKELIIRALEREIDATAAGAGTPGSRVKLPLVRLGKGRKLDLRGFDFDDLLT